MSEKNDVNELAKVIKQQRVAKRLSLKDLAAAVGISQSHLGRIERGERFPSANVLRRFAEPLGFREDELFTLAGFLSEGATPDAKNMPVKTILGLDPYVARALAQEPVEIQRAVVSVLTTLKSIAGSLARENRE